MCTCVQLSQIATNWRHHKMPKFKNQQTFSPPEGNRINRSRQNLACKRIPWVCSSTLNLALIGKGGWELEICPKLFFFVLEGCTINLACKRRLLVYCLLQNLAQIDERGWAQEPPKCENLVAIATLQQFFPAWATNILIQIKLSL